MRRKIICFLLAAVLCCVPALGAAAPEITVQAKAAILAKLGRNEKGVG